ncbi:MAG: aspartyl/asparaginyl beta-hydroxylase domain-containing protein [Betaproteobacteria bacterium]|nr:aspartyl/asparaginyl beta-hydroxylase domain-containing protein [Betaproteobacteria bacterium]
MLHKLIEPAFLVLYVFIASAVFIHLRGRVRHPFARQLTDHSTVLAPYNAVMYAFSGVPNTPYQQLDDFPELKPLVEQWTMIRDEAANLFDEGFIKAADKHNDAGFNSFFKTGWARFYLKWYDGPLPSAEQLCPKTVALVESIPSINAAMFALLPPGAKLVKHRDPFAGSLRYHLGLITPNSPKCFIEVDGERYFWRDGEAVMFDETFIHYAHNQTETTRVIFFADIERPLTNPVARWLNRVFKGFVMRAAGTRNLPGERVGGLNRAFEHLYKIRIYSKRLKKWTLLGLLAWWIFA